MDLAKPTTRERSLHGPMPTLGLFHSLSQQHLFSATTMRSHSEPLASHQLARDKRMSLSAKRIDPLMKR
jgi:hypothetical protein